MPADYESLFKPSDGGDDDSPPVEDEGSAHVPDTPVARGSFPQRDWEPAAGGGAGPMPVTSRVRQAETPEPQRNTGLPPGPPPPARPPARSWPGMPPPGGPTPRPHGPAVSGAPSQEWGAPEGDTEATTVVPTAAASDVLNRPVRVPSAERHADGRTEIVNVWPATEAMVSAPEQLPPVGGTLGLSSGAERSWFLFFGLRRGRIT